MRKLITRQGENMGAEIALARRVIIGRDEDCDVVVADPNMSRHHAEITTADGLTTLMDLSSSNGSLVNGLPVSRIVLSNGDEIQMGQTILVFWDDEAEQFEATGAPLAAARAPETSTKTPTEPGVESELNRTRLFAAIPDDLHVDALKDVYLKLKALYRLFMDVAQAQTLKLIAEASARALLVTLGAKRVAFLLNAERSGGSWQRLHSAVPSGDPLLPGYQESADVLQRVRDSRAPVLAFVDANGYAHYTGEAANTLAVPIIRTGAIIAVLYVETPREGSGLTKDDVDFAITVALQITVRMGQVEQVQQLRQENIQLRHKAEEDATIVVQNEKMKRMLSVTSRVAETESSVLITGESGTGKELIARTIHAQSPRRSKPLVAVNCAALPETLLESELFGHEKGAFTGAHERRIGKFELADGGTLFLDEIGDISLAAQSKLLRSLQEGEIQRVGGIKTIKVNVRLIAATNKNLQEEVLRGSFRQDLYFRIRVIELQVPPLRERPDDVPALAEYFLRELRKRIPTSVKSISPGALHALSRYPFPGNVRELRNVIERGLVFAEGEQLLSEHLPLEIYQTASSATMPAVQATGEAGARFFAPDGQPLPLADVEKLHITSVLSFVKGNKLRAASLLGISRTTLYEKLRAYGMGSPEAQ